MAAVLAAEGSRVSRKYQVKAKKESIYNLYKQEGSEEKLTRAKL